MVRARRSILYVCDFNGHGGTQTHLIYLLERLSRDRFRPLLATLNLHPRLAGRLGEIDVEVRNLGLRGALRLSTWRAVSGLSAIVRREPVDLVHGFLFQGNLLAAAISRLGGAPCMTSVRNVDAWKRRRHRFLSRKAHGRALRVVFNSRAVRDITIKREGIPAGKTSVIVNGVEDWFADAAPARPASGGPRIVCVASLREKKGHRHLLSAFSRLLTRQPSAKLILAGEGPLMESLGRLAAAEGIAAAVSFVGHRSDLADILASGDIFVLPSLEEGMPNALLEAMSASLPSVVTRVGGNEEVVREGETGLLVPPADPGALASALEAMVRDEAMRRRMGASARRLYEEEFTVPKMIAAYETLYDEVLGA